MRAIDLRSDTFTKPNRAMLECILDAELGDDVEREDPTVIELEETASRMLGKEAGLLTTSGTQANLLALMVHCGHGDEVILEKEAHIYYYEVGGMASVAGLMPKLVQGTRGVFTGDQVRAAHWGEDLHYPHGSLVAIENTHNRAGGCCWSLEQVADAADAIQELGMRLHVDGARIFNASLAQSCPVDRLVREADTVMFCLSKGLAAPVGSMLVGDTETIERARKIRKMIGGGMRQAGVIAAPGLYALRNMVDRLQEDHDNARVLAEGLRSIGFGVDMSTVQTNIVIADVSPLGMDADTFVLQAENIGIRIFAFSPTAVRFVTHYGIGPDDVSEVLERLTGHYPLPIPR